MGCGVLLACVPRSALTSLREIPWQEVTGLGAGDEAQRSLFRMESLVHVFFSGLVLGIILFQTAIVAPTLFKSLGRESFGVAIRDLWPKFFLLIAGLGVATTGMVYVGGGTVAQYAVGGATACLAGLCYALIPATNRATDSGDQARFDLLHRVSVGSTVVMLLANLAFPWL